MSAQIRPHNKLGAAEILHWHESKGSIYISPIYMAVVQIPGVLPCSWSKSLMNLHALPFRKFRSSTKTASWPTQCKDNH